MKRGINPKGVFGDVPGTLKYRGVTAKAVRVLKPYIGRYAWSTTIGDMKFGLVTSNKRETRQTFRMFVDKALDSLRGISVIVP